jgi:methionyl-tRNA formyltransferase
MKIVFFGTSPFAARVLASLFETAHEILAVVTRPDRPQGRSLHMLPPAVKETSLRLRPTLPVFQPEKASTLEFAEILKAFQADLFVVVAYGEIIKQQILDIPKIGCINIHASILPHYRGAAPMQRALMDGVKEAGVTIMEMVLQMDAGDMIAVATIPVPEEMTFGELEEKLCALSCQTLINVLDDFVQGNVKKIPQNHEQATLARKIAPEEEEISWNHPAENIHNQIRALSPRPGAWCKITIGNECKRLKIKRSQIVDRVQKNIPGTLLSSGKQGWIVGCAEGSLQLLEVQLEGKKAMKAEEFFNGLHLPFSLVQ